MRSASRLLFCSALLLAACAQVIGLSDYEEGDEISTAGRAASGGRGGDGDAGDAGSEPTGGTSAGTTGSGGEAGQSGEAGMGGSGNAGGNGNAGGGANEGGGGSGDAGNGGQTGGATAAGSGGEAGGPSCMKRELLVDGDFEDLVGDWTEYDDQDFDVIYQPDVYPVWSGDWVAWLGDSSAVGGHHNSVSQTVTIPARTTALTFSCELFISTEEVVTQAIDFVYAGLWEIDTSPPLAASGDVLRFGRWSNLDAPTPEAYMPITATRNAAALAGQELDVRLWAVNDASESTDFLFDDCSLLATVCE